MSVKVDLTHWFNMPETQEVLGMIMEKREDAISTATAAPHGKRDEYIDLARGMQMAINIILESKGETHGSS